MSGRIGSWRIESFVSGGATQAGSKLAALYSNLPHGELHSVVSTSGALVSAMMNIYHMV